MLKEGFDPKSVNLIEFESKFSETTFLSSLKKDSKKLGEEKVYDALKLFHCYKSAKTPVFAKTTIAGALGYLTSDYDIVPDSMPVYGMVDDIAIIDRALNEVKEHIDEQIEVEAKQTLKAIF